MDKEEAKGQPGPGHNAACSHGKEFGFYPEGSREPQQGRKEGSDVIRCIFSKNLS